MHKQVYDDIAANLNGITSNTTAQVNGKFSFDPDELREIVKEWLELAGDYRASMTHASLLSKIEAPGIEFASSGHATIASSAGQVYLRSLKQKIEYCVGQAQRCQDALDTYLHVEHHEVGSINQVGVEGGL